MNETVKVTLSSNNACSQIRDDFIMNVFVSHFKLDQKGQILENQSVSDKKGTGNLDEDFDSEAEEEEQVDAEKDDEEEQKVEIV